MPDGGALSVETGSLTLASARASATGPMPPGRYVVLSVRDTGTGMDEATLARIFEPFFTTKLEGKGTGLGLATVLSIVEQSGGYLAVTSAPGRGTTFDIFLPEDAPPRAATAAPPAAPGAREQADATETVLVVEDEQSVRTMLRRILQAEGYRVLEARHGADALLIVAEDGGAPVDLVLTDLVMPEMGGVELLAALHLLRPALPTIVVSGYAPELLDAADEESEAVLPSPAHFLAKPFTTDGVLRVVRDVLDRRAVVAR
jgi:two-component system cell cycle sensor histidine kinase/response regulator CckA